MQAILHKNKGKTCLVCGITRSELQRQRRYNGRNMPCLNSDRHSFTELKSVEIKIDPNQLTFELI